MRKIISIILIAIMFVLGVSSVYAVDPVVYTPRDFVYTASQLLPSGYSIEYIDDFDTLSDLCDSLDVPYSYTSSDHEFVLWSLTYSDSYVYAFYCWGDPTRVAFSINTSAIGKSRVFPYSNPSNDPYYYYGPIGGSRHTGHSLSSSTTSFFQNTVLTANFRCSEDDLYMSEDILFAPIETINGGLVSLQSGNALVIDTLGGNVSQIGLFTTLPVKSSVFSAFRSGASYFATNDLNSIKSIDFNTHAFTWDKQEGTTGILGQTDKGVYTINNPSGGRYLVIVNPRYMPRGSDHFLTNNPITVAISGTYRNLFRFSLSQSDATLVTLADQGESLIETDEGGTNSFGGSVTFNDIPDTDPLPSDTPVIAWGTGNTPDYSEVPSLDGSVIGQATENLQGIRSDFNGFFGVVRDCISWLPPQLITLLVAAMSLLVAVGIVKALL